MRGVSRECCTNSELSSLYISVPHRLSSYEISSPTSSSDTHGSSLDFPNSPYPLQSLVRDRPAARQHPTRLRPQDSSPRIVEMHSTPPPQAADADIPLAAPTEFGILKCADSIPLAFPLSTKGGYTLATPAAESHHVSGSGLEVGASCERIECNDDASTPDLYPCYRTRPRHHRSASTIQPSPASQTRPRHRRSASAIQPSPASQTAHIFTKTYEEVECQYTLEDVLGDGFMGVVYRCTEKKTGQSWACKTIRKISLSCNEDVASLRSEVAALRILQDHLAVVSLHDVVEDEDRVSLIMELCKGGELFDAIASRKRYTESDAARVVQSILSVVHYMNHHGLMHRDLKPENVVLVNRHSLTAVRVVDFGQATSFTGGPLTDLVGSSFYIAPEVLDRGYGPEADMWSTGVVLYILLCGRPPFAGHSKTDLNSKIRFGEVDMVNGPWRRISDSAKHLVTRMLTLDPQQRITPGQAKRETSHRA